MRRDSINIDAFHHGDAPIPVASRVDNVVYSGAISGYDAAAKRHVDGLEAQTALMFSHVRSVLAAAGASPEDVVRMTFYVKTPEARAAINPEWMALFPNPSSRPARHIINYETPKESLLQCDFVAVVAASSKSSRRAASSAGAAKPARYPAAKAAPKRLRPSGRRSSPHGLSPDGGWIE